jgi:hypothetical protein
MSIPAAFGGVPQGRAVHSAEEELILGWDMLQRIEYKFDYTRSRFG